MAENGKQRGGGRFLLLVGFFSLALASGALFFFLGGRYISSAVPQPPPKAAEKLQVLNLEPFLVNLADGNYRRYLKITLTLEFAGGEEARKELEEKKYRLRDAILGILRGKKAEDLLDQEALRRALQETVNGTLEEKVVKGVYFQDLVIQ